MYKWFLDLFGWKTWTSQFTDQVEQTAITYQNTFNSVGSWTAVAILLGITILMVVLYYYVWYRIGQVEEPGMARWYGLPIRPVCSK